MGNHIYEKYIKNFDINLLDCTFLGKGHNGAVYMLPDGKIIKVFFKYKNCSKEYFILDKVNKNKYFPRTYCMNGNYIIRDYVDGTFLHHYIKEHGISKDLTLAIVDLLEEFKKLKFTKLDIRCKDIVVKRDGNLMVIDPKKFYSRNRNYPKHLSKGLKKLGVFEEFMSYIKQEKPTLYNEWSKNLL